jgi:hypothetical protein
MSQPSPVAISPVEDIISEMRAGRMVILVDEEDRENEGDLVLAADHVTPEAINFMARFGRGLICLTLTRERCERPEPASRWLQRNGTLGTAPRSPRRSRLQRASPPAFPPQTAPARCRPLSHAMPNPRTWCSQAMCFRCKPSTAAF